MSDKSLMHGSGESRDGIVPTKSANKGRGLSAEQVEGRLSAEEIGPMLDTEPEHIGAYNARGSACSPRGPGRAYLQGGNRVR
jgi:hypothetical protein